MAEMHRRAVGDRHRGKLQPLPVTRPLGTVNRHRDDWGARLERQAPDSRTRGVANLTAAGTPALWVDDQHAAIPEDPQGGGDRLLVALSAADGKRAGVRQDELQRAAAEQLRLGHEPDAAPQEDPDEPMV